ncbi:unnamed protein product [Staurois parvus]|uniref:Uncharacterized protein n=1 Tax=Staurois parvus TaxID=386267 RepID=A0ABN9DCH0_9NEOB|nr:unnamed protein product [Staurois parvus]
MSVTPSQSPPVSECPPQSCDKSLITAITSKKKKSQYLYCHLYNFHRKIR